MKDREKVIQRRMMVAKMKVVGRDWMMESKRCRELERKKQQKLLRGKNHCEEGTGRKQRWMARCSRGGAVGAVSSESASSGEAPAQRGRKRARKSREQIQAKDGRRLC